MDTALELNTAALYSQLLNERSQQQKFDPTEIRLSEVGGCARKQTLRALGYEAEEPDERSLSIFESGDQHEDAIYHLWADQYPRRVRRQIKVQSPFGVGHIDIWVAPIKHLVESKSTTEKSRARLPLQSHIDQVTMYLHFWGQPRGATAEIAYRIKETGEILSFPVEYDEERAALLVKRLGDIQAAIHLFRTPVPVPDGNGPTHFPCAWPTSAGMARCPFWQHCWGYGVEAQPDKKGKVIASVPSLSGDVQRYTNLKQQEKGLKDQLDAAKSERTALEGVFSQAIDDAHATALAAGDTILTRTKTTGRTDIDTDQAIKAGVVTREELEPFRTQAKGYDRWTIRDTKSKKKVSA